MAIARIQDHVNYCSGTSFEAIQRECEALHASLMAEKEKVAKLRQYLASHQRIFTQPENELDKLKSLVEDQTPLIEQLYQENPVSTQRHE